MENDSFLSLLYRYFFFSWLFRDADRGGSAERAAAWRHNREQTPWLLVYLKRWLGLGLLSFALGCAGSLADPTGWAALPGFIFLSLSLAVDSVIVVAWLGLRLLPAPCAPRR